MSSATLEPLPMSMPKTRSSSSLAVSESLADKLPGLRSLASSQSDSAIDQEPASSALSSVSTLSQLSDQSSDDERPSRARRRRVALNGAATQSRSRAQWRSPSPVSSKSSDNEETEDEDSHGQLKPGHKRFLAEGLYAPPKPTSKTIDATQPETVFSVLIETPVSPVAPDADAEVKEAEPEGEEVQSRAPRRASSLMASTKLARDGRGKRIVIPKASASSIETEKPFTPETPLNLPSTFKGPLLPLPTNFGEEILEEKRDFKLSYAIHRDFHTYGPGRQRMQRRLGKGKVPSRYMTINKNFYPERHKLSVEIPAVCQCPKGSTCGADCLNRILHYLCSPKLCPAGPSCTNRSFTDRPPFRASDGSSATKVFYTGNRGFGLKAVVNIPKRSFIMEYRGEVISKDESYDRVMNEYKGRCDFYFLDYDGDEVIDAGMKGNKARFCNHSCDPNCRMIRYGLAEWNEWQIGLFADKDIKAGDELTYDYGWVTFASMNESSGDDAKPELDTRSKQAEAASSKTTEQRCHCGAANCVGFLGAKKKKNDTRPKKPTKNKAPAPKAKPQPKVQPVSSSLDKSRQRRSEPQERPAKRLRRH